MSRFRISSYGGTERTSNGTRNEGWHQLLDWKGVHGCGVSFQEKSAERGSWARRQRGKGSLWVRCAKRIEAFVECVCLRVGFG